MRSILNSRPPPPNPERTQTSTLNAQRPNTQRLSLRPFRFFELPTQADTGTYPAGGLCFFPSTTPKVRKDRPLQKELSSKRVTAGETTTGYSLPLHALCACPHTTPDSTALAERLLEAYPQVALSSLSLCSAATRHPKVDFGPVTVAESGGACIPPPPPWPLPPSPRNFLSRISSALPGEEGTHQTF